MKESLTIELHKLVHAMDSAANRILLKEFGLTYNRAYFLFMLQRHGSLSQQDLSMLLGYRAASVSTMVSVLQKAKLITVTSDPDHGRKNIVSLTLKGEASVAMGRKLLDKHFQEIMQLSGVDVALYTNQTKSLGKTLTNYIEKENI